MIKDGKKIARMFLDLSLNPVPVKVGSKVPVRKAHQEPIKPEEIDSFDFEEIGISTGFASINLEVLDFDLKNTDDPIGYMESYNSLVPKELLDKLVKQHTPSNGFHYIYRCKEVEANQPLARNKEGAAVIETRGIGGYIKCSPSQGYKLVKGSPNFIEVPLITNEERALLFILARQKDELILKEVSKKFTTEDTQNYKRFSDFNQDSDKGIELLEDNGWTFHSENREWYNLTRPNSKSGDLHGGYNRKHNFFQCFSTAQGVFEERRGYNNHHIFAELECDGNYKRAYAKLYELGYGSEDDYDSDFEDEKESLDFLSDVDEENIFLEQSRKGEIPMGVSLGWRSLDKNFKLKKNQFYFFLGVENIGKSTMLSSIMAATKTLYGYKWGISSPEATSSVTRRNLIEAASGKSIESFEDQPLLYSKYLTESREHFFIVRNDRHWSIDQILEKGKQLYLDKGIDFLLIDPYSFYASAGEFSKDSEILSKIRVFCQKYCSVLVVDHTNTDFVRTGVDQNGFLQMPTKYNVSGGNAKANRCDDFVVWHRIVNHPDSEIKRTMQWSTQKVKDVKTGGEVHLYGEYSELVYETRDGFTGYWDVYGDNPIYNSLRVKRRVEEAPKSLPMMNPEDAF